MRNFIKLEGGLGTQILGMIAFHYLSFIENRKVNLDLSYFKVNNLLPLTREDGLTVWPWALGRYGFDLESLRQSSPANRLSLKKRGGWVFNNDLSVIKILEKALDYKWNHLFPFKESTSLLNQIQEKTGMSFTVVHVRGGDYLKVSSKVVSIEEVLPVLKNIKIDHHIIFTSDSQFSKKDREYITNQLDLNEVLFLDNPDIDQHEIHCLMRHANFLICSNSTFSFTAALLAETDTKVLAPTNFFKGNASENNFLFQKNSKWMWV